MSCWLQLLPEKAIFLEALACWKSPPHQGVECCLLVTPHWCPLSPQLTTSCSLGPQWPCGSVKAVTMSSVA